MHRASIILLLATLASAGQVILRDGSAVEGEVRLSESAVLFTPPGGKTTSFDLAQIEVARFSKTAPAPARPAKTGGLLGEYYADRYLSKRLFTRIDPAINFTWTIETPHPLIPQAFSVRWTGQITAPTTDTYTFILSADDGVRLWIDEKQVLNQWHDQPATDHVVDVPLVANQAVALRLEYYNANGVSGVALRWQSPAMPKQFIAASALKPADARPATRPAQSRVRIPVPAFDGGGELTRVIESPLLPGRSASPVVGLIEPCELSLYRAPAAVKIRAAVDSASAPISRVRFYDNDTLISELIAPPWQVSWQEPHSGNHLLSAEVIDTTNANGLSDPIQIRIAGDGKGSFPAPWAELTIRPREYERPTPPVGHATHADGTFILRAAPGDLLTPSSDNLHFAYVPLEGDGQIVAHLAKVETPEEAAGALVGLMVRDSARPESRRFAMLAGRDFITLSNRADLNQVPENTEHFNVPLQWLKLVRFGELLRAYASADGKKWMLLGEQTCAMNRSVLIGMAGASNDPVAMATATFDHVRVIPGPPAMDCPSQGFTSRDGIFTAARVISLDDASFFYAREGKENRVAVADVARIAFRPLLAESSAIAAGRTGVLLRSGDFVDGDVRAIKDGKVSIANVLFGNRTVEVDSAVAAFLATPDLRDARYALMAADGSIYPAREFHREEESIIIETTRQGEVRMRESELKELRILSR